MHSFLEISLNAAEKIFQWKFALMKTSGHSARRIFATVKFVSDISDLTVTLKFFPKALTSFLNPSESAVVACLDAA